MEVATVLDFKAGQGRVDEVALRHDDDIVGLRWLMSTEHLSNQSFSTIPDDRSPKLPCGGDA